MEDVEDVEEAEAVRPLEAGEWAVSTVSLRFCCVMVDIGE